MRFFFYNTLKFSCAMLAVLVSACGQLGSQSNPAPSPVTASGCKLDSPIRIHHETLLRGPEKQFVLAELRFDKPLSGLPISAESDLSLMLYELAFDNQGKIEPLGMLAYTLEAPSSNFLKGQLSAILGLASLNVSRQNRNENGVNFYSSRYGNENLPDWKIEAVVTNQELTAVELTYSVATSSGVPNLETRCLKSGKLQ